MAPALTYRLFEEHDMESLARLWEEESDWGTITAETLGKWLHTPYGQGVLALAVEDDGTAHGRVVGQLMFFASVVFVRGQLVAAVRPGSAIISRRLLRRFGTDLPGRKQESGRRGRESRSEKPTHSVEHPIAALYVLGVSSAFERGAKLVYALPNPAVAHFFELLSDALFARFPLWSLDLTATDTPELAPGLTMERLTRYDERVDALWQLSSLLHDCQALRTAESLEYKTALRSSTALLVEQEGSPVALATGSAAGDRQWLIYDLLVRDREDSLRAALIASIVAATEHRPTRSPNERLQKIGVLATPTMEPMLHELGFTRDDYEFPLVVQILDPQLDPESVAPERWYVSAND